MLRWVNPGGHFLAKVVSLPGDRRQEWLAQALRSPWLQVERRLYVVAFAVPAVLVFLLNTMSQGPFSVDDAYIFYRYATNWADGYGPVFNPGEHVEGYSSLLWTAILAAGAVVSVRPEDAAPALGAALGAVSMVCLSRLAKSVFPETPVLWALLPLACALSSGLAAFALTGMDTLLFVAALLAATMAAVRGVESGRTALLSIVLAILVLSRAEGAVYALGFLAVLALIARQRRTALDYAGLRHVALTVAVALAFQMSFRLLYYGEIVPATVSAKGYTGHALLSFDLSALRHAANLGLTYQAEAVALALLPLAALAIRSSRPDRETMVAWIIATPIVINLIVTALAAGDWMQYHRLNLPVLPLIVLLIASELMRLAGPASLVDKGPRFAGWLHFPLITVILVVVTLGLFQRSILVPSVSNMVRYQDQAGFNIHARQAGLLFRDVEPAPAVLSDTIGELAYYGGPAVYVWDIYGLTDEHNSKHGNRWTPQVGRSDDAYNSSRPFDVLVTNDPATMLRVLEYWQAHPDVDGASRYAVYDSSQWLRDSFFVVALQDHPVAAELQRLCDCRPVTLTEAFIHAQKAPWETERLRLDASPSDAVPLR